MTLTITEVKLPQSKYSIKCPFSMTPQGITMHNTANDASAMAEISYMQGNGYEVSFHYAVDDTRAVQGLPLNRNGWHAGDGGSGKGNRTTIGVEICYSKSGGASFIKAEKNAAELVARILKSKGWGINKVGKHQDYWQGTYYKYCPHRTLDLGWQRFLNMVQNELNKLNGKTTVTPPKTNVKPTTPTPKPVTPKYKEESFNVRQVTDDVLRVRKEPNTKSAVIKVLPKGKVFTPTKIVRNGESVEGYTTWCNTEGGWVSMAYTTPVKIAKPAPKPKLKGENLPNSGYYRVTATTNIRSGAGTNHRIVGTYAKGQGFNYDRKVIAGGYVWLSYVSYSGQRRYVAVV